MPPSPPRPDATRLTGYVICILFVLLAATQKAVNGTTTLMRIDRQPCRRSVQRFEVCDQVGALGVVLQARIDHGRVWRHRARIGEVFVKRGEGTVNLSSME
jgi:hypothetical protein